jgi:hypothetical protein
VSVAHAQGLYYFDLKNHMGALEYHKMLPRRRLRQNLGGRGRDCHRSEILLIGGH